MAQTPGALQGPISNFACGHTAPLLFAADLQQITLFVADAFLLTPSSSLPI